MDMTDKSAQPSMEEILASIRKLLSEESDPAREAIDFNARPIMIGDQDEDESSEFDLPAIFRSSSSSAERARGERSGASLVRLTDAIRSVTGGMVAFEAGAAALRTVEEASKGLSSLKVEAQPLDVTLPQDRELQFAGADPRIDDVSFFEPVQAAPEPQRTLEVATRAPQPSALPEPLGMTASSEPRDVQRVMAPFKDTKFKALSSPGTPVSTSVESVPPTTGPSRPVQPEAVQPDRVIPGPYGGRREPELPNFQPRPEVKQGLSASFPQAVHAHREDAPQASGIEEAAADLLRPMLRSWLAENMPKMVEKALVLEMQQQLGTLKKSGGSEG